jgi:hypothetical protein
MSVRVQAGRRGTAHCAPRASLFERDDELGSLGCRLLPTVQGGRVAVTGSENNPGTVLASGT